MSSVCSSFSTRSPSLLHGLDRNITMSHDEKCKLFVGAIPRDMDKQEYEEEVQKWGEVVGTFFMTGHGWGTVQFRTKEYRDKFLTLRHK